VRSSPWKIQTDIVRHIETNTFLIDQKSDCICHIVLDCQMERCISPLRRQRQTDRQQKKKVMRSSPCKIQTDLVRHIEINTIQVIDQKSGHICHIVLDCQMERCLSILRRQRQTGRQQKKKVVRSSPWKIQTDIVRHIEINTIQVIDQKRDCIC
jgi:hypothetical protein